MADGRYYFTKDIAAKLGCRTDTVRRMYREDRLPGAFKPPGRCARIRISERDLRRLMKDGKGGR